MTVVRKGSVVAIGEYEDRGRRVRRAMAARRRLHDSGAGAGERRRGPRTGGRVWVNGAELGGTDPRHAHLAASFD